ncbi:MAG: hypothetical protein ACT4PL_14210 [Phycisphaerales bacterium]
MSTNAGNTSARSGQSHSCTPTSGQAALGAHFGVPGSNPSPSGSDQFYVPEFERPPADGGMGKVALVVAVLGVAGLAYGLIRTLTGGETPRAAEAAPMVNMMSEQQAMMREALDMARQAQQLQRERLDMMREQMIEGDRMPTDTPSPGGQ